ncbi:fasciclin domain-containing protein [Jannaschia sp. 2305UL9-9]|uniref:fasciclin domain-containing protein n=1 Tax=Jannaschia sp. 2305UL9-9 TaxID=3121638 RepID=UPI00352997C4
MASLLDTVSTNTDFSILTALVGLAEAPSGAPAIAALLDDPATDATVFAPTDTGFAELSQLLGYTGNDAGLVDFLLATLTTVAEDNDLTLGALVDTILRYHVVGGAITGLSSQEVPTLAGQPLRVDPGNGVLIDQDPATPDIDIEGSEVSADNGTVRAIDLVLLPKVILGNGNTLTISSGTVTPAPGTPGDDSIIGTDGADTIRAGDGDDFVNAGSGPDRVFGQNGDDVLQGRAGDDRIYGQNGDDRLFGGSGRDFLDGGAGNDTLNAATGRDVARGGDGDDLIRVQRGSDTAYGGEGNDTILGDRGRDILYGDGGDDSILGGSQRDLLLGGTGADTIEGEGGSDLIRGEDGNDSLDGGQGDDLIYGGDGDDTLFGGTGNDTIEGGAGNDVLIAGTGDDSLVGGTGNDTVQLTYTAGATDIIVGGNNNGTIFDEVTDGFDVLDMSASRRGWTVDKDGNATSGDHTVRFSEFNVLVGSDFADDLSENGPSETSFIDEIHAGGGDDIVRLNKGGSQMDFVDGGEGTDTLDISLQNDGRTFYMSSGFLSGHRLAANFENVIAGDGDDDLFGTAGNNRFESGAGGDDLYGMGGSDTFVFQADGGANKIHDFDTADDTIVFDREGYLPSSIAAVSAAGERLIVELQGQTEATHINMVGLVTEDFDAIAFEFL